jgi:hypothetical protein
MTEGEDYRRCKCGHVSLVNYHTDILPGVCPACERNQDGSIPFSVSPRYGFRCDKRPKQRASPYAPTVSGVRDYGAVLDCVYEMAEQVATGNGWSVHKAIGQVLKDEGWTLLPTHKKAILNRIADDRIEAIFATK